jgi:hypothetical protein
MSLSNEDIKQLINILQKALDPVSGVDNQQTDGKIVEEKQKRSYTKKSSKKDKTQTEDKKPFFYDLHKEDIEFDKKVSKYPPTPRTRKFSLISVKCRTCGKEEKVSPYLAESKDRYKCNKCSACPG